MALSTAPILSSLTGRLGRSLKLSESSYLERILTGKAFWLPQSVPQWLAVLSPADELFYGGAAGGGKTDLGLGLALETAQRASFFRVEFTELQDVIDRGDDMLAPLGIRYNYQRRRWEIGDRFIQLAAINHPTALRKYQGRARDLYVFDEVSFFQEAWVTYLTGWLRSHDPEQRTRILLLGNPPTTPEGEWVVRHFAPWLDPQHPNPARPGELRWFIRVEGKEVEVPSADPVEVEERTVRPRSRTFIPAFLDDNPFLADTGYRSVLEGLPDILRRKLLEGDFSASAEDDPWQVIPTMWVMLAQERWRNGRRPDLNLRCAGLDVSRGGDDHTVLARLYHEWFEINVWPGNRVPDGPTAAQLVTAAMIDDEPARIYVDVIGVGSSAYDSLKALVGDKAIPINVANSSTRRDKTKKYGFNNLRSEIMWKFREALDPASDHAIALPPDRRVRTDLCAAHFEVNKTGIKIESKDEIKKRIGFSPDYGDAILLAWYGTRGGGLIA